jgi:hypothetical protein
MGLWFVAVILAPWVTFVPMLSWRDASRLLPVYYPAALIVLFVLLVIMAVKNPSRPLDPTQSANLFRYEKNAWAKLSQMSMVLNGETQMAVADGFARHLSETSQWATQIEQRHASDPPVAKAARQLRHLIDELQDTHAQKMQHAENTAAHGVVVIPTHSDQLKALAGTLFAQLTVFELNTCSPPPWVSELYE